MKILHTSDWHLGRYLHEYSLIECQEFFINWLLDYLKQNKYDAVIIAGDVFDRSIPPAEAVNLFGKFLSEFSKIGKMNLFVIPGNHDSADRVAYCSEILSESNIFISGDDKLCRKPVRIYNNNVSYDFYMIPFITESAFFENGKQSEFNSAIENITENKCKDAVNIIVGHAFVAGSEISESERIYVGGLAETNSSVFNEFDYAALGHLHKGQKISEKAFYSGSPLKYSFSEADDVKHVISIEFENKNISIEKINIPQKIEMKKISGCFNSILNEAEYKKYENCFLEISLQDNSIIESPVSILKNRFPYLLSVRQSASDFDDGSNDISEFCENNTPLEHLAKFYEYVTGEIPTKNEITLFTEISGDIHQ